MYFPKGGGNAPKWFADLCSLWLLPTPAYIYRVCGVEMSVSEDLLGTSSHLNGDL